MLIGYPPAKVNLYLHVGLPRKDGRHPLDSLVMFASSATDRLIIEPDERLSLTVEGPYASQCGDVNDNLVLRAADLLAEAGDVFDGAEMTLIKQLPCAAGIGGGSSDAAEALRMLSDLWGLPWDVGQSVAPALGGDGLAAYLAQTCLMRGDGAEVRAAAAPSVPALLVNPNVPCPTGDVYARFDQQGGGDGFNLLRLPKFDSAAKFINWLKAQTRNDLEGAAVSLVPEISGVLETLSGLPGAKLTRMSGSGATCFALFGSMEEASAAHARMLEAQPGWWAKASMLGGAG